MLRTLLKSKIHRARVTDASVHYVGSVGIDETLMKAADIMPYEHVMIADITNGARLETYAIPEPAGSGKISILGAAAKLIKKDDLVIIFTFGAYAPEEIASYAPRIVLVDEHNQITSA